MAKRKILSSKTFPWGITIPIALLTLLAFVISYSGLIDFATAHKIAFPHLWPAIIDGVITMVLIIALKSELDGRDQTEIRGYFITSMAMAGVSVVANVVHMIEGETPFPLVTYIAHAIAPIMIAFLCHILLKQVAHSASAQPRVTVLPPGKSPSRGAARTLTSQQAAALVQQHGGSRRAAAKAIGCAWRTLNNALKS